MDDDRKRAAAEAAADLIAARHRAEQQAFNERHEALGVRLVGGATWVLGENGVWGLGRAEFERLRREEALRDLAEIERHDR